MLAARYWAPRDLRLENTDTPLPDVGEVVVKVLASNICGTDLKSFLRGHPLMRPPMTMGHEFCGVVSEVGEGVKRFKAGDRVVASNSSPCGTCTFCRQGAPTLCERIPRRLIGFSLPGSHAQYVKIPRHIVSENTYSVKASVTPEEMACSEPLAAAIHALDRVNLGSGMRVVLIGSGALGLMLLQMLKTRDIHVTMANRSESRLRIAEKMGAWLRDARFMEALAGNLAGDAASQGRQPILLARLRQIAALVPLEAGVPPAAPPQSPAHVLPMRNPVRGGGALGAPAPIPGRVPLWSSNLQAAAYDPGTNVLTIEFRSGTAYAYNKVPQNVYEGLVRAASHGRYFHQWIRDRYRYRRLR